MKWLFAVTILSSFAICQESCHDYVIISTRGTDEVQGPSIAFTGMINSTLTAFPGGVEYDTKYPAGQGTERLGAADIIRYIDEGICACPDQKYVLLGYSQGAAATGIALQEYVDENSWGRQAITAVITVGNPIQRANESAVVDETGGSSTRQFQGVLFDEARAIPQTWYDSGKLKEVCHTNDLVCVGGQPNANFIAHLQYGSTPEVQQIGAKFIAERLRAEGVAPVRALVVDKDKFAAVSEFKRIMSMVGGLGLRTPASPRQNKLIDWTIKEVATMKHVDISVQESSIVKWQTQNDQSLAQAGSLSIKFANGTNIALSIAGAIPWSQPSDGTTAKLVYIPQGVNLTTTDVAGKIVIRDFGPVTSLPYSLVFFPQLYRSNDTNPLLSTSYSRPYTGPPNADMIDAGIARAAGYISMFNVPGSQVESYFDPHEGTHYRLPGIYVGKEVADVLRAVANSTAQATMSVNAIVANDTQRQVTATLPGKTNDTIYIVCHTDGNTYVQDNGISALLTLADYFSSFDQSVRTKTLKFVFTTGHLGYTADSTVSLSAQLDATYDTDDTVLALALEHMGTREILSVGSLSGAANGNSLDFTGKGELMVWSVGPSESLRNASINAAKKYDLNRVLITQGASVPDFSRAPAYRSFGGIGTGFHQHLIPTAAIISGPWSLWAPSFGESAIDYDRLRDQTLAFAELITTVDGLSKSEIAGGYVDERAARRNGTKLPAIDTAPPVYAPAPV